MQSKNQTLLPLTLPSSSFQLTISQVYLTKRPPGRASFLSNELGVYTPMRALTEWSEGLKASTLCLRHRRPSVVATWSQPEPQQWQTGCISAEPNTG